MVKATVTLRVTIDEQGLINTHVDPRGGKVARSQLLTMFAAGIQHLAHAQATVLGYAGGMSVDDLSELLRWESN